VKFFSSRLLVGLKEIVPAPIPYPIIKVVPPAPLKILPHLEPLLNQFPTACDGGQALALPLWQQLFLDFRCQEVEENPSSVYRPSFPSFLCAALTRNARLVVCQEEALSVKCPVCVVLSRVES